MAHTLTGCVKWQSLHITGSVVTSVSWTIGEKGWGKDGRVCQPKAKFSEISMIKDQ